MNSAEFISQIEYHLSQLATRNYHHLFERLCTEIARRRIAANIVVATGPVGAGGDHGRDAESFETDLPYEVASWFSLRATTAAVAIACSTERDYERKIRHDVKRIIAAADREFDRIVCFSNQPIPISKNHALSSELTSKGPRVAIWDRFAVAYALAEPDLQWVAQHYLELPAELIESLEPSNELRDGPGLESEVYYVPGQALVDALAFALDLSPLNVAADPQIVGLQRWYVALHLALDQLPITDQHAYELSRQHDEAALALRGLGSSGAEALQTYGL